MQNSSLRSLAILSGVALAQVTSAVFAFSPGAAIAREAQPVNESANGSASVERLAQMFSPQIRNTINACWQQGKVNLAAGAGQDGRVTCGDGTLDAQVRFNDYMETVSNILAASSLVGFRAVTQTDTRITPAMLGTFLSNSQGQEILRNTIQTAIVQSELLPPEATDSSTLLTNAVITKLMPVLRQPEQIEGLLGTSDQYSKVVTSFCTAPGMSVDEAISSIPGLNPLQLYAICIQESGVTNELQQVPQQAE